MEVYIDYFLGNAIEIIRSTKKKQHEQAWSHGVSFINEAMVGAGS